MIRIINGLKELEKAYAAVNVLKNSRNIRITAEPTEEDILWPYFGTKIVRHEKWLDDYSVCNVSYTLEANVELTEVIKEQWAETPVFDYLGKEIVNFYNPGVGATVENNLFKDFVFVVYEDDKDQDIVEAENFISSLEPYHEDCTFE